MRREKARVTITFCSMALAGLAFSAGASAEQCSRKTLEKVADTYVQAQKAGKPAMVPLAEKSVYAENDKIREISKGVLSEALTVDFTRSFYDEKQCAAFTELVAATHSHPYVILTRMEANKKGQVWKMESVVTDEGDWVFGATPYLNFTKAEKWDEIPKAKRATREAMQKAADSYIDNWGDPALPVLHGTPCARLEGRVYTGTRDPAAQSCTMGAFPQRIKTGNRRYVIDETLGAVVIFHDFSWIDAGLGPEHPGTPAAQMFRIEDGKNRYIHEVTACTTPGCGRGRPAGAAAPGAGGPGAGPGPGGPGAGGPGGPRGGGPGGPGPGGPGPGGPGGPPPAAPGGA
jgi:hypothetical protein